MTERDYYFLWSFERVALSYNLTKVGGLDWYTLGSALILRHQNPDGAWRGRYGPEIDTAFALLFLKRSNFAPDLSANLRMRQQAALTAKDPAAGEPQPKAPAALVPAASEWRIDSACDGRWSRQANRLRAIAWASVVCASLSQTRPI